MSNIIDGKAFAQRLCDELKGQVEEIKASGTHPCIAVVLVGDDPASHVYVRNKVKRCEELDIKSIEHRLDENVSKAS